MPPKKTSKSTKAKTKNAKAKSAKAKATPKKATTKKAAAKKPGAKAKTTAKATAKKAGAKAKTSAKKAISKAKAGAKAKTKTTAKKATKARASAKTKTKVTTKKSTEAKATTKKTTAKKAAKPKPKPDPNDRLFEAIEDGDVEAVGRLLAEGASIDARDDEGDFPLLAASESGELAIVELLLDAGAPIDAADDTLHYTALMRAVSNKNIPLIDLLVARGADVDHQGANEDGNTALLMALDPNWNEVGDLDVVRALLRNGADPNRPNDAGWTPLMFAAHTPEVKVVAALLAAGADPKAHRAGGIHAIDVADGQGHREVQAQLLAAGSPTLAETVVIRMRELWQNIDRWFVDNAPHCHENLARAGGASPELLLELQRTLEQELPPEFHAYLQLHGNGDRVNFYEYDGLPVERMLARWRGLEELRKDGTFATATPRELSREAEQVQWQWWHPGWLPFAQDGGGNLYCIDLDPGPAGRRGQVIAWEMHSGPVGPLARSFEAFLDKYLERLRAGRWTASDGGCLVEA